ncbi:hypothetical protein Tco_1121498 [Tanacetum coccineum]|uniref:Uncharacterized protein n=1 Tax=Tanacetum coccineum TaxID=301880 RepID=A0ABQ5J0H6_9ASTR
MAKIAVGEGITRSVFGVKGVDLGEEEAPYWTTLGKRESYKPRPSSDGVGAQTPYYARKDFLDRHFPEEWEISRDAELNPFKDTLVFRRMVEFLGAIPINLKCNIWESEDLIKKPINWDKPPKNRDGAWHAKIRLIDPDGEGPPPGGRGHGVDGRMILVARYDLDCVRVQIMRYLDTVNVVRSNEQFDEIVHLKKNLFEQVQEKDCLMKTVSELKNKLKLEENRNIEREIDLEKKIKQLDNIIFKRGQSAQTVHMMTKSKICYDHSSKQAIGFEKPFCLKKARESKPKLYDGNTILKMDPIEVPDSDETKEQSEKSRSKMILKEQDPLFEKYKVNTKPINYAILNNDYYKRFVRQTDLYSEHAYWKATSVPPLDPSHSSTTVIVEVPKELPTVSMVNTSLKKLKRHLTGFDQVVKERTTATAITEGTWGFEHTKACFRDEIIPFIKELKDIFNNFNQYLVEELADVQKVFYQMEQAIEQHRLESRTFEVKMNKVLSENERLLTQAIDKDIVKTVVNLCDCSGETVTVMSKVVRIETELS